MAENVFKSNILLTSLCNLFYASIFSIWSLASICLAVIFQIILWNSQNIQQLNKYLTYIISHSWWLKCFPLLNLEANYSIFSGDLLLHASELIDKIMDTEDNLLIQWSTSDMVQGVLEAIKQCRCVYGVCTGSNVNSRLFVCFGDVFTLYVVSLRPFS